MKRYVVRIAALSMAAVTALAFTGCGTSGPSYNKSMSTESAAESAYDAGGLYDYAEAPEAEEFSSGTEVKQVSEEDASSNTSKRKLITNISMNVETREFDSLVSFLRKKTDELGGYIESESINNRTYNSTRGRDGSFTIRIPENKLDGFLTDVAGMSNITSQDRNVMDVTLQYADLEGHKKALLAEQQQLLTLMEKAENIEDILKIQTQLSDVQYQLESMESQLRTFDNQVSYSTVVMNIDEVVEYTPDAPPTFGQRAKEGFIDNWNAVVDFFKELLLAIITHIPTLVILAIVVIIVVIIVKALDKKAKKNKQERMKNMPPQQYVQGAPVNQNPAFGQPASTQIPAATDVKQYAKDSSNDGNTGEKNQ